MRSIIVAVPEFTDLDDMGPYAIICQHCSEPWGSAYLFEDDDGEEES